ncbi:hypothetical protein QQY79_20375 [Flavobacterium tructae]|uniref:hypothetical protein n=1 Tax=Flavobacterium TaxID=237 RepID=UPI00201E917B|nr:MULTISPECIES: hypothetical protein [Flavobacterium]MDL2144891.1 hypothetical protein [Flavobacterium tructae]URC14579.1 hypothetical protein M4I44_09370 [Flavobacterium sp. B183]
MKKIVVLLLLCLGPILFIFVLHTICLKQNINIGKFKRNFSNVNFGKNNKINLPFECNNIIEVNDKYIILNKVGLNTIIKIDFNTKKTTVLDLKHRDHNSNFVNDTLYSFDPHLRMGFRYDANLRRIDSIDFKFSFDRAIAIGESRVLFRASNKNFTKGIFKSYDFQKLKSNELPIRLNDSSVIDGGLSSDGFFTYQKKSLFYVQYNKGQFYKIDINLQGIKSFKTIDKINRVGDIKISKDSSFYFSKPVLNVNLFSLIHRDKLFVISFAKGETDVLSKFLKYRTVDVYNVNSGKYRYSFYLPNDASEKAHDAKMCKNKLYLLFNSKIVVYEL